MADHLDIEHIHYSKDELENALEEGKLTVQEYESASSLDEGRERGGVFLQQRIFFRRLVNHMLTKLIIILLIFFDIIFVIVAFSLDRDTSGSTIKTLDALSFIFVCIFLIELSLRIFVEQKHFYKSWFNLLDGFIIAFSFVFSLVLTFLPDEVLSTDVKFGKIFAFGRIFRLILLVRSVRILLLTQGVQKSMRLCVGGNKNRYQKDGYDLDLCYITKRMIAMSFPSSGLEGAYRNRIETVARFLDEKHPGHYKVYNLCSEKSYDHSHFHNQVERFMIDDHNVPTINEILRFAKNVHTWMNADPENVIAVHCKGGKGRTGTMICIWLLESNECTSAEMALKKFGDRRTDLEKGSRFQGVETPSQSRFVEYFDIIRNKLGGNLPAPRTLKLKRIHINSIVGIGNGDGSDFSMIAYTKTKSVAISCNFASNLNCLYKFDSEKKQVVIDQIIGDPLTEEIKVMFFSQNKEVPKLYDDCAFFFSFHTYFIDPETNQLNLPRHKLDNPHREKAWSVYNEQFSVDLFFE